MLNTLAVSAAAIILFIVLLIVLHWISYRWLKVRIVASQRWGLNICCGNTDGGGINADIVKHSDVPNFVALTDIYCLPFEDGQFETVLCSHTAEHIEDVERFDAELRRVGKEVVYILPPIWDLGAAFNVLEHRWIFLSMRKRHTRLPKRVPVPFARHIQAWLGQKIHA
ncbi:MAG: methyltransferase domain-containing protein [Pseudomonadota bacterium]